MLQGQPGGSALGGPTRGQCTWVGLVGRRYRRGVPPVVLAGWKQLVEGVQVVKRHRNAQRCLRRLAIFNPYADQLGFIGSQTRHRRDHQKYLSLINSIALLHQYQHTLKTTVIADETVEYIEVSRRDIALANHIADWALGRSVDELSGATRRLLIELYDWLRSEAKLQDLVTTEVTFTRRKAREAIGWTATQFAYHLERLCRDEYAIRAGGGCGKLCCYRLLYDGRGQEGQRAMLGLVDASSLQEPARV